MSFETTTHLETREAGCSHCFAFDVCSAILSWNMTTKTFLSQSCFSYLLKAHSRSVHLHVLWQLNSCHAQSHHMGTIHQRNMSAEKIKLNLFFFIFVGCKQTWYSKLVAGQAKVWILYLTSKVHKPKFPLSHTYWAFPLLQCLPLYSAVLYGIILSSCVNPKCHSTSPCAVCPKAKWQVSQSSIWETWMQKMW